MMNKTLYQKDHNGRTRIWKIRVEETFLGGDIIIDAGLMDGKLIETITSITEGTNIGKSNERNPYEQALFDAQTEINKKLKTGYVEDIDLIKSKSESATIKKPMKAERYHPTGFDKGLTLQKLGLIGKKIAVQRKFDGWRFRVIVTPTSTSWFTSSGDVHPGFPHISEQLMSSCLEAGYKTITLDGEIYNHKLGFQKTASACGTKKMTPEKISLRDQMDFHLFDVVIDGITYEDRYELLEDFYSDNVLQVETILMTADESKIDSLFVKFLDEGYEGLMFRVPDSYYEYKRSKNLLKYKPLQDAEFKVIGFEKSITGETTGSIVCQDDQTRIFSVNLKNELGTDEMKKRLWDNQKAYIGKYVNVQYLNLTDDGVPRHGRARYFRKWPGMD